MSGSYPIGAASELLRAGARYCVGARFRIDAHFSASFFQALAVKLAAGGSLVDSFAEVSGEHQTNGSDLWRDLACLELLGGP